MNFRRAVLGAALTLGLAGAMINLTGCGSDHHDGDSPDAAPTVSPTVEPAPGPTVDPTSEPTYEPSPDPPGPDEDKITYIDTVDYDEDNVPDSDYKVVVKNIPPHRPNLPILEYGPFGESRAEEGYYSYSDRSYTFIVPDGADNKSVTKVRIDNASCSTGSTGINYADGGEDPNTAVESGVPYEFDYNDFEVEPKQYNVWVRSNTDHAYEGSDLYNLASQNASFIMEYVADGQTYTAVGKVSEYKHARNGDIIKDIVAREGFVLSFNTVKTTSPFIIINKITAGDRHFYGQLMVNYAANKDADLTEFQAGSADHRYPELLNLFELDLADFQ